MIFFNIPNNANCFYILVSLHELKCFQEATKVINPFKVKNLKRLKNCIIFR